MIGVSTSSNDRLEKSLQKMMKEKLFTELNRYGELGVAALAKATPVDENITANSWAYRIVQERNGPRIEWYNTNVVNGVNVAVLIVYGHGTRRGGYVVGRNFVNPTMQPLFDQWANEIWQKVVRA